MKQIDATESATRAHRQHRIEQFKALAQTSERAAVLVARVQCESLSTEMIKALYALVCALTDVHEQSTYYRYACLFVTHVKTTHARYMTAADVCAVFNLKSHTSCAASYILKAAVYLQLTDKDASKVYKLNINN